MNGMREFLKLLQGRLLLAALPSGKLGNLLGEFIQPEPGTFARPVQQSRLDFHS